MKELIFLKPVFKETVWGGNRLKESFDYDIPSDHTGECWGISAHRNGDCEVASGTWTGQRLSSLWQNHKELFGHTADRKEFPLLVKIIDAKTDLSIQVHPDDNYAKELEQKAFGKNDEEFKKLLIMPEAMIIYRFYFEEIGLTDEWWNHYVSLTDTQKALIDPIIWSNNFDEYEGTITDIQCLKVLSYYKIKREDAEVILKKRKEK